MENDEYKKKKEKEKFKKGNIFSLFVLFIIAVCFKERSEVKQEAMSLCCERGNIKTITFNKNEIQKKKKNNKDICIK